MKFFHNGLVDRSLNFFLVIGTHTVFALGMYFLGRFLGGLVLRDIPNGADIFGIILAVVMFLSALKVFVFHEYTKEDVHAYERSRGDGSFMPALTESQMIVAGLEISSLLFRCYQTLPNWFGAAITLVLGLLLLRFAYNIAKVMHAQTNRPAAVDAGRMREEAARSVFDHGRKHLKELSIGQKRRIAGGDAQPLDEFMDERERVSWERKQREEARRRELEEEHNKNEKFTQSFLNPKDDPTPPMLEPPSNFR